VILGALAGVFAERELVAKPTRTPLPNRKGWILGIIFGVGAWILAAACAQAGVQVSIQKVPITPDQPLEMAVLSFVVAGGRSVASKLSWSPQRERN
jgi:hypothetical protein